MRDDHRDDRRLPAMAGPDTPDTRDAIARAEMHRALMAVFCNILRSSQLSPIAVLSHGADALGAIYREVADVHRIEGGCSCGWHPLDAADIARLQAALADAARAAPPMPDLRNAPVAGRA